MVVKTGECYQLENFSGKNNKRKVFFVVGFGNQMQTRIKILKYVNKQFKSTTKQKYKSTYEQLYTSSKQAAFLFKGTTTDQFAGVVCIIRSGDYFVKICIIGGLIKQSVCI
eukprot:TRINITY_DN27095_c0_g1_i2.p3 TRINITY_DN27095_c0_g1~~TRINITY_DN27095_c0_g1_i2.p3  ORF type:complete len:130 (-),score=0.78 TRINITY_DN27095_c0_g1_i2:594-926(-)